MNRDNFFNTVKTSLFGGKFTQEQVDGLTTLLDTFESSAVIDERWQAYMLATVFHECNKTMQPIKELGGIAYFKKMYDISGNRPSVAKALGNIHRGDGAVYFGRGYVQLTGRTNYERAGKYIGVDLLVHPELALVTENSAKIMVVGMVDGWFTGKKLSSYFTGNVTDWVNARKIINGTDKAQLIASYAQKFYVAITSSK